MSNQRWADHYQRKVGQKPLYPEAFVVRVLCSDYRPGMLRERCLEGQDVLDLSCGYGRNLPVLLNLGCKVTATEITDRTVNDLRPLFPDVDFEVGLAHSLPFDDARFDGLVACNACYYIAEGATFAQNLTELRRVLKAGGWLLASLPTPQHSVLDAARFDRSGVATIDADVMGLRDQMRMQSVASQQALIDLLEPEFRVDSVGHYSDDFQGFRRDMFYCLAEAR